MPMVLGAMRHLTQTERWDLRSTRNFGFHDLKKRAKVKRLLSHLPYFEGMKEVIRQAWQTWKSRIKFILKINWTISWRKSYIRHWWRHNDMPENNKNEVLPNTELKHLSRCPTSLGKPCRATFTWVFRNAYKICFHLHFNSKMLTS
jgi:hypothetical protein